MMCVDCICFSPPFFKLGSFIQIVSLGLLANTFSPSGEYPLGAVTTIKSNALQRVSSSKFCSKAILLMGIGWTLLLGKNHTAKTSQKGPMGTRLPEESFFVSPGISFPRFFGLSDWWCLKDGHIVSKQWAMTFSGLRLCNGQCFSSETGFRLASFLKIRNCKNNTNSTTLYGDPKRVPSRKVERVPRAYLVFLNLTMVRVGL